MKKHAAEATSSLRVLIVEEDDESRDRLGRALESAGHQVLLCPGPSGPDYTCVGLRGGTCALANGADVVVLDTRLRSDDLFGGTTGWQLALLYRDSGLPLVALVEPGDAATLLREEGVTIVRRPASARVVLRAVNRAASERNRAD